MLDDTIKNIDLSKKRKEALEGISLGTNFYLQYQGQNDLELQITYGEFIHHVMGANYPQWVKPLFMPSVRAGEKIRIGYVSVHFRNNNGANWSLGWIKHINRKEFEIYCYYIGSITDRVTDDFRLSSDVFHHIPRNLEKVCQQIIDDKIHILIYTDLGMEPQTMKMAALRLAPIQCTALGHPITSGLPTIDYYLSRDLMEPENAQEHYSEKLIRLPNLGVCYPNPELPKSLQKRSEFNLKEQAIIYLSCQSLFKYLPQYDYIFPSIARRVPQAQFAFIEFPVSQFVTEQFKQRLQKNFADFKLNSEDYCVILPRLNETEYLNLNLISDIYLDSFSWSGDNTTIAAIACNLPIVTCPGEFMRSRHSYGILKRLGLTETVAKDEADYIDIAVRLGVDAQFRQEIVKKIKANYACLYDDKTCIEALEQFYQRVVHEYL